MANNTDNLNLSKPELNDFVLQTIANLAQNFQKLDDVSEVYVNEVPLNNVSYPKGKKFWKINPNIGDYIGWINVREGQSVQTWKPKTAYSVGDKIRSTIDNTHVYTVTVNGTSAPLEPNFKVSNNSLTKDLKNVQSWTRNNYYEVDEIVIPPVDNGFYYVCNIEGNAGNSEPTWKTNDGDQVVDNNITWTARKIITWKESGSSANFRPWGKID